MSREEREELRRTIEAQWASERHASDAEETSPLTLAELLQQPAAETDATLQAEAFELKTQVNELADEDLHQLRARLATLWPATPFKDLVTVTGTGFSLAPPAHAWLFLAPAAEMPVTDEQWAELATNPVIFDEQSEWLSRQATVGGMRLALELMTDMGARGWLQLLDCCPAPPPGFVVNACAAAVTSVDRPNDTRYLMERLVAGGVTDGARMGGA